MCNVNKLWCLWSVSLSIFQIKKYLFLCVVKIEGHCLVFVLVFTAVYAYVYLDWCQTMRVRISLACGFDHMLRVARIQRLSKRPFHRSQRIPTKKICMKLFRMRCIGTQITYTHRLNGTLNARDGFNCVTNVYWKLLNRTFECSPVLCGFWHERPLSRLCSFAHRRSLKRPIFDKHPSIEHKFSKLFLEKKKTLFFLRSTIINIYLHMKRKQNEKVTNFKPI